jgi:putative transposase
MRTRPWEVDDDFWQRVEPLIPAPAVRTKRGRPRVDNRTVFSAILYVLRTGMQWNAIPKELCSSSVAHARFQEWERAGLFRALCQAGLMEYDEVRGIDWEWQAVDGAMTESPFGGAATGANPTDRGKLGVKRSLLTDADGIPLGLVVDGANRHDSKLLTLTLDAIQIRRPRPNRNREQHLCLDKGYDYPAIDAVEVLIAFTSSSTARLRASRLANSTFD